VSTIDALQRQSDRLFIGGTWTRPRDGRSIEIRSPYNEQPVGTAHLAGPADVDRAVTAARTAFDHGAWAGQPPQARAEQLERLATLIEAHAEAFALLLADEVGSPVSGLPQAQMCVDLLRDHVRIATTFPWMQSRQGIEASLDVRLQPAGVVAAIAPWNVPLFLSVAKLAPALLAGCTVVLKPAEETPLHALLLGELLAQLELPPGVVNIVPADRATSELLVRHPGVDKVSFTGSSAVGRRIAAICGEHLKRCSLELGGKSAAIVLPDVDPSALAAALAPTTIVNNGQMCANQTRVLVPDDRHDEIVDALCTRLRDVVIGDPREPATELGPLINARQRERVEGYIALGVRQGARLALGGCRPAGQTNGFFIEPTVFVDVDNSATIAREEIFGPVVTVIRYRGEDDAVALANDSPYGLAGSVWSENVEHARAVARRVRSGIVGVNTVTLDLAAPFGGFKDSGIGREGGPEGVMEYCEIQVVEHVPTTAIYR
jgi:aldehyde dehydrogenase (NAD+)